MYCLVTAYIASKTFQSWGDILQDWFDMIIFCYESGKTFTIGIRIPLWHNNRCNAFWTESLNT